MKKSKREKRIVFPRCQTGDSIVTHVAGFGALARPIRVQKRVVPSFPVGALRITLS
jgi:hypothetical protein